MIFKNIWERYFFKELIKVFILFLSCFFFLYALMDYSMHMQDFIKDKKLQIADIFLYYGTQFIKRAVLIVPLGLLVATIKVLCSLNAQRELVALQTSGMKLKTLLRPFFALAAVCTLFNFFSSEYLLPQSLSYVDQFHESHFKHDEGGKRKERMHVLYLKDGSKLVYQTYIAEKDSFFDVIWIRSSDDIWRIKYLKADPSNPIGQYVDHVQRNRQGNLEKTESYETCRLEQLKWRKDLTYKGFVPIENRSISELYRLLFQKKYGTSAYEAPELLTQLLFKCVIPFFSLIVVMACAPYCIQYSRGLKTFLIYAVSLFGFIAFFTVMNGAVILGENLVVPPFLAILGPFALCAGGFAWKFIKTT